MFLQHASVRHVAVVKWAAWKSRGTWVRFIFLLKQNILSAEQLSWGQINGPKVALKKNLLAVRHKYTKRYLSLFVRVKNYKSSQYPQIK